MDTFLSSVKDFTKETLPNNHDEILKQLELFTSDIRSAKGTWKKSSDFHVDNTRGSNKSSGLLAKQIVETYNADIKICDHSDYWSCRYSEHVDIDESFYRNKIVKTLNGSIFNGDKNIWELPKHLSDRCLLEKEYIHSIEKVTILEDNYFGSQDADGTEKRGGWVHIQNVYKLSPILKKREFNEWVYIVRPFKSGDDEVETSYVLSIRAHGHSDGANLVQAYYISIEKLKYDYRTKTFTWLMCTTSDCKGFVPFFLQKLSINKAIVQDVPLFFSYVK